MKTKILLALMFVSSALLSCIQDEALNTEAAIDACTGNDIQQSTIDAEHFNIQLYVSKAADLTQTHIKFQLPQGATIVPVKTNTIDNTGKDFYDFETENPRQFKVISEDKAFEAIYEITVWQTEMPHKFHFETLSEESPFHVFYEEDNSEIEEGKFTIRRLEWASGNPGFKLTAMANTATEYPTVQINGGQNGGKCLKLETKSTGDFGSMVKMPLAAGNLFIGSFDKSNALKDAMKATRFGFPFFYTPLKLEGYYKYTAGKIFTSNGNVISGKEDHCDIYGIMYDSSNGVEFLDGSNSLTSPAIVLKARKPEGKYFEETNSWTRFELDFIPTGNQTLDPEKLAKGIYKLAIVFSSSLDGNKFEGAIGSTLLIDEVKLTVKP